MKAFTTNNNIVQSILTSVVNDICLTVSIFLAQSWLCNRHECGTL